MKKSLCIMVIFGISFGLYGAASNKEDDVFERFVQATVDIQHDKLGALDRLRTLPVHDYEEEFKKLLIEALKKDSPYSQEYARELLDMLAKKNDHTPASRRLIRTTSFRLGRDLTALEIAIFAGNVEGVKVILTEEPDLSSSGLFPEHGRQQVSIEEAVKKLIDMKQKGRNMPSGQLITASLENLKTIQTIIREHAAPKRAKQSKRLSQFFSRK